MNIKSTESIFVKDLNANDRFALPGSDTVYVCDQRATFDSVTTVTYHIGEPTALNTFRFAKVNLSTVYLVKD